MLFDISHVFWAVLAWLVLAPAILWARRRSEKSVGKSYRLFFSIIGRS
jgi:hypothetical protein